MSLEFREMTPDEANTVNKVMRSSFGFLETLFMSKPKHAVLAVENGEIAGGIAYKVFPGKGGRQIGYAETAFVTKAHAGKGICNLLYRETTNSLKGCGCEVAIAMVRDDNVASWRAFENSGYNESLNNLQIKDALAIL